MKRTYSKNTSALFFASSSTKILVLGMLLLFFAFVLSIINKGIKNLSDVLQLYIDNLERSLEIMLYIIIFVVGALLIISILTMVLTKDASKICLCVKKKIGYYKYGNPLHLQEGEFLPNIECKKIGLGIFELKISASTNTVEEISNISSSISSALNKRYKKYAVTITDVDVAFNEVIFKIEDVAIDKKLVIKSLTDFKEKDVTKLIIQKGTYIDLTTSGSMLVSGKTRSGKTTSVIALLLQVLKNGRDEFGSEVMIIDPKQAELSRLPNVYSLDEKGEARLILDALNRFADAIVKRQQILNDMSEESGDVVHWWEANFKVSLLFIDEYVACRSMFPKRATKEDSEYNLAIFDGLIKRIVTMGASAGCYVIISIAEASVDEGGLPAMLRSAMTTKILFKPTLPEGRLMWDSDKLKDFNIGRVYNAGDAWFSSTDGIHDFVTYVHFPVMEFPVYAELKRLLKQYYE